MKAENEKSNRSIDRNIVWAGDSFQGGPNLATHQFHCLGFPLQPTVGGKVCHPWWTIVIFMFFSHLDINATETGIFGINSRAEEK